MAGIAWNSVTLAPGRTAAGGQSWAVLGMQPSDPWKARRMSGPAVGSCLVSLLVPHPTRLAVLVADGGATGDATTPRLPTFRMGSPEPGLPEILARVDVVDTAATAVLRVVVTTDGDADENAEAALMVELDAGVTDAPTGWTWADLDTEVVARLEPWTSRTAVAAWAQEHVEGWSPRRPQWSRPGWWARASTWVVEQMAAEGLPAVGAPRPHQLWGLSVVLRGSSSDADVFFKCSADLFRHEAVVTQALAARMPAWVPEVVAVDDVEGWLLMRDLGATELGEQDESLWHEGVRAHAGIQQSWLGRADELVGLGLPVRSLTDLAAQVEATTDDTVLLARLPGDVRDRWLSAAPALVESCRRLDEIGPGPALVHGDFHPWNVAFGPAATRVFDWTDAAVSHPFVDLATYVFRTDDQTVRRHLVETQVEAWSATGPEGSIREATALGLVVGALYQWQTYRTLLPTLVRDGADDGIADADLSWITRSLSRHERGLDSPT